MFLRLLLPVLYLTLSSVHTAQSGHANELAGLRHLATFSKERGETVDVTVWYPAKPGGTLVTTGESVFFVGTPAMRDAPVANGRFPLILLSHGAGLAGTADAMSWLGTALAQRGFVVAAPTHPGNGGKNRSAEQTMKLWLRPADMSAALGSLEADPSLSAHVRPDAVGALGLSMGGGTVLLMAGAQMSSQHLAGYCDTDALNPSLCGWLKQSRVDLHKMDFSATEQDRTDHRIGFVMAIDPAPTDALQPTSLSRIGIPVNLINLGMSGQIPATLDAQSIANAIPNARYAVFGDGSHFSLFGECKPGAAESAEASEVGDPVCADGGNASRRDIHARLINQISDAFHRHLTGGH